MVDKITLHCKLPYLTMLTIYSPSYSRPRGEDSVRPLVPPRYGVSCIDLWTVFLKLHSIEVEVRLTMLHELQRIPAIANPPRRK